MSRATQITLRLLELLCLSLVTTCDGVMLNSVSYGTESENRIIGGSDVISHKWPWMVSLMFRDTLDVDFYHVCGGSLLTKYWVLTAAHCVDASVGGPGRDDPARYKVMIGGLNIYVYSGTESFVGVMTIHKHSGWLADPQAGYPDDIALLYLDDLTEPVTPYMGYIDLPNEPSQSFTGFECWITGWGITQVDGTYFSPVLQEAVVPVISNALCAAEIPLPILFSHLCTGGATYPTFCSGDSGGPVACYTGDTWYLAGIASWTYNSCDGFPSVNTRVSSYLLWIKNLMITV